MQTIQDIQAQLINGKFEFSRHAFKRAVEPNISDSEIRQAEQDSNVSKITLMISTLQAVCSLGSL